MEQKKRVEWRVGLYRCNVGERKGEWYPRVQLWGTVDLEQVIDKVVKERSDLRRETLQATASMLADKVMDFLVKGYAVSTPLGTFTPGVTGMWNPNRLLPEARAQNKAVVNYTMSKELKSYLADPLFRQEEVPAGGPRIHDIIDLTTGERNRVLTAGSHFLIKGRLLLMNGDLPERGVYLLDEETGKTQAYIPPEELQGTRSELFVPLPADVPEGTYRLRVGSQCTTNPQPMKAVAYGDCGWTMKVIQKKGG